MRLTALGLHSGKAATEAEVRATLATLPVFQAGMLEIVALAPLEPYPGLGPAQ